MDEPCVCGSWSHRASDNAECPFKDYDAMSEENKRLRKTIDDNAAELRMLRAIAIGLAESDPIQECWMCFHCFVKVEWIGNEMKVDHEEDCNYRRAVEWRTEKA